MAEGQPRFMGELLCDWVNEPALNAIAEQLEVNPPVETEIRDETEGKDSATIKLLPSGLGFESSSELTRTASRAQTFRSASVEVRLRLILDRLLLDDRLRDPINEGWYVLPFDPAPETEEPTSVEALKREWRVRDAIGAIKKTARELAATREWTIVEGTWSPIVANACVTLQLLAIPLTARFPIAVPSDFKVDAWLHLPPQATVPPNGPGDTHDRMSSDAPIRATIFGTVDDRVADIGQLRLHAIAVFDRKSGSDDFRWTDRGRDLRAEIPGAQKGLLARIRGR